VILATERLDWTFESCSFQRVLHLAEFELAIVFLVQLGKKDCVPVLVRKVIPVPHEARLVKLS
jgi:hypothetical protein